MPSRIEFKKHKKKCESKKRNLSIKVNKDFQEKILFIVFQSLILENPIIIYNIIQFLNSR